MIDIAYTRGRVIVLSNTFAGTQVACEQLTNAGFQLIIPPPLTAEDKQSWLKTNIRSAQAVIVGHDRIDRELIQSSPDLKVIAKQGVGLDGIDLKAAEEKGITILTAAGGNSDSVADLTILLILAISRNLIKANSVVKDGRWDRIVGHEVWTKKLGLIGFGEIGQRVAQRALGFSMQIGYFDIVNHEESSKKLRAAKMDLHELMSWADYISVHLPLNKHTQKFINQNLLSMMKPTAYLINTSRGGVIDERALYEHLVNNRIAGAGLDVFETEPPLDLALSKLPNLIATPHMASYTVEAINRVSMQIAEAVIRALG